MHLKASMIGKFMYNKKQHAENEIDIFLLLMYSLFEVTFCERAPSVFG
jgi:hypothetical protein